MRLFIFSEGLQNEQKYTNSEFVYQSQLSTSFFQCNLHDFSYNPINVKRPIGDISDVPRFLEKKMSHYFSRQL